jgi:hypothetical protein
MSVITLHHTDLITITACGGYFARLREQQDKTLVAAGRLGVRW